jgi:hypothetical protein
LTFSLSQVAAAVDIILVLAAVAVDYLNKLVEQLLSLQITQSPLAVVALKPQ